MASMASDPQSDRDVEVNRSPTHSPRGEPPSINDIGNARQVLNNNALIHLSIDAPRLRP
jgi:hypothetical protein